jgi:hypothetical protein
MQFVLDSNLIVQRFSSVPTIRTEKS